MDVMLNVDVIIVLVLIYDLMLSVIFLKFMYRNFVYELVFLELIGVIEYRDRVVGLIVVGGFICLW